MPSPASLDLVALKIARALVVGAAGIAVIAALAHLAIPMPLAAGMRELLIAGCVAFAALCVATSVRLTPTNMPHAVLAVAWAVLALVGVICFALGEGVGSSNIAYIVFAVCVIAVLVGQRAALLLAAAALLLVFALGAAEAFGALPAGAHPTSPRPLGVRVVGASLLVGAGSVVAIFIARIVAQQMRELQRRGERFGALLRIAADWYWELDSQLRFSRFSEELSGTTGLDADTHLGRHPWELPLGLDDDTLDAHRADLEAHRSFHNLITRLPGNDGAVRFVSISGEPRFDDRGVFRGYWGVCRDISDEVRVRQAREASETRYQELFDRSLSALVLHRNGIVLDANAAALQLFGYPDLGAMVGRDMLEHYPDAAGRARVEQRLAQMETLEPGGTLPGADFTMRTCDGRRLLVTVSSVRVDAGGPATLSIFADETERHAAESALRGSQALLAQVLATSPDLIALTEIERGRFVMINDSFTRVLGYTSKDLIGRSSLEVGTWQRADDHQLLLDAIREHGQVQDVPLALIAKSGAPVPMLVSAASFDFDGRGYLVINARDVSQTERTRLEREVMFENASIGIAFTRDRRFVQANPRFEQMAGWPTGTLAGQPGRVVWASDEEYAEIGALLGPQLAQGRQVEIERPMRRRDGSEFWCRMIARAVDPTRPGAGGTVWICEDITERRRVEQALQQARDAAEAASRAKSAFLANTSHELRTPLNGLLGLARLAQHADLDAKRRQQYIEQIAASAQSLTDIIADILDLSKIEAGKLSVESVPFDLPATLRALHRAYLELAQARNLTLTLSIDGDVPTMVLGDPVRTRQIVSNYVTNALKFTSRGSVHIGVACTLHGDVRLAVRDTGPGIDAATAAKLFHPFTQADSSTTRRFGGTGLGLSICRELAELMGGRAGVDSEPGRGSVFWAELPLQATDEADPVSGFGGLDARPLAGTHVLVVEDNAVNMMICVALLEQQGVRVGQATDGRQAVEAVDRAARGGDPFDAVLMDVQMPQLSGHEATRLLRKRYDAQSLPIIALTAAALVSEREQALSAGMNDFLTKPIEPRHLLRALSRVLRQNA